MSLIHDALARAREEAARREALARGESPASTVPPAHYRFRSPLWTAGLLVAAVLVGGVALGLWWAGRGTPAAHGGPDAAIAPQALPSRSERPGTAAAPLAEAPADAVPLEGPEDSASPPDGGPTPTAAGTAAAPPSPDGAPPSGQTVASVAPEARVPSDRLPAPAAAETPTAEPPPAASAGFAGSRAELGSGRALELQGVVWNTRSPSAVINGTLVEPGDSVEGFELLRIEPRVAVLSDGRREITLRLGPDGG